MSDYNAAFALALRRDMERSSPFRKHVSELVKNREVEQLFPGRDGVWLQKELSKWRGRLSDESFNGTLRSLQLYCTLKGITPNDVLLPSGTYFGPSRIEFLGEETIITLARSIREEEIALPQGMALPVLYAPEKMTAVFLFLHPHRRAGVDTVSLRFGISEPEGFAEEEDGGGAITTALDSSLYVTDLSRNDWEERLRSAYRKIRGEFESVCDASESPLAEAVNDFYSLMRGWPARQDGEKDLLFAWYPPRKSDKVRRGSLDSLSVEARGMMSSAERER